jgi:DedD protein
MSDRNNSSNRQVVHIFIGFLILFVLAFSLGVVVGKGLGGAQSWINKKGESMKNLTDFKETGKTPEETAERKPISEQIPTPFEEKKLSSTPAPKDIKIETMGITKKDIAVFRGETDGRYTVQIGAFQREEEAKKIVKSLISKGYPAFIKSVDIPGKGTWYRIRVGKFKTREEAELYGDNLKKDPDIKSVLIKVND